MKVNFQKLVIKDIEGNDVVTNLQPTIGNQLYMQGRNIEECELGRRIYHADGAVELTEKECDMVRFITQGYSYIAKQAIEKAMEKGE
jgi:hypothetical protein